MSYFLTLPAKLLAYFLYGIAFKLLWGWFVAETFNLPSIPLDKAWGIAILIRLMGDHYIPREAEVRKNLWRHSIITPCLATGIGFAIYTFGHLIPKILP